MAKMQAGGPVHRALAVVACAAALAGVSAPLAAAEQPRPSVLQRGSVGARTEWVTFADSRLPPVRVVRGTAALTGSSNVQIVSFGTGFADIVKVVRGLRPGTPEAALVTRSEARPAAAKLLRTLNDDLGALFGPAAAGELDRIAFAIDGVESRHGADLRMWRAEPLGPQGPMQVSAAAAYDVGGGDRFDLRENRLLGRAYLDRMFRRYGNWFDALAAYNWGPGNVDAWIAAGRLPERMPFETTRYIAMVLRDALVSARSG
jgi:hypothetical protein